MIAFFNILENKFSIILFILLGIIIYYLILFLVFLLKSKHQNKPIKTIPEKKENRFIHIIDEKDVFNDNLDILKKNNKFEPSDYQEQVSEAFNNDSITNLDDVSYDETQIIEQEKNKDSFINELINGDENNKQNKKENNDDDIDLDDLAGTLNL